MSERYLGPVTFTQQPEVMGAFLDSRDLEEEQSRLEILHQELLEHLESSEISVLFSDASIKSTERIIAKAANPGRGPIIPDLYALRLVVGSENVRKTFKSIRKKWPMPREFPWGFRTARKGGNHMSHSDYKAIHMNFTFDEGRIAEVKLFTPEQFEVESQTREFYEQHRVSLNAELDRPFTSHS